MKSSLEINGYNVGFRATGMCRLQYQKVLRASPDHRGFTLIELLLVIAILVILVGLRLPAYSATRTKSKGSQCLDNVRQLSLTWLMYAEDNHEYFLYSSDDGYGTPPYKAVETAGGPHQGNNYAWTWSKMDFTANNPYNYDPAADFMLRPMWRYNQNAGIYKCPGDTSMVASNGTAVPRIRTYSMNWFLGGFGGNPASGSSPGFRFYTKLTDLADPVLSPGAANTFLFIEERQDWINWGNFQTDMSGYPRPGSPAAPADYGWRGDLPGAYHDRAGGISFCDGHAEIHKWLNASTTLPVSPGGVDARLDEGVAAPYSEDVAWMQNVAVRPFTQ